VVHETYRAPSGQWYAPSELRFEGAGDVRKAYALDSGEEIAIGSIEKMSKSKRNTVDPDDIIDTYGADTARWFMLSDSPPERDVIWTEEGVQGAGRFVQRLWRLVGELADVTPPHNTPVTFSPEAKAIRKAAHLALKRVSEDIERLRFNRCVAHIYELSNFLSSADAAHRQDDYRFALREAASVLVQLFAPMMPHLAEECWEVLQQPGHVAETALPLADETLLVQDEIVLPVQINGKKRGDLTVPAQADQATIERLLLEQDFVLRVLEGRPVKKLIVVPQRIINVVV